MTHCIKPHLYIFCLQSYFSRGYTEHQIKSNKLKSSWYRSWNIFSYTKNLSNIITKKYLIKKVYCTINWKEIKESVSFAHSHIIIFTTALLPEEQDEHQIYSKSTWNPAGYFLLVDHQNYVCWTNPTGHSVGSKVPEETSMGEGSFSCLLLYYSRSRDPVKTFVAKERYLSLFFLTLSLRKVYTLRFIAIMHFKTRGTPVHTFKNNHDLKEN